MRIRRLLLLGVAILVLAAVGAASLGSIWIRNQGLPRRKGRARLPALGQPVEVRWDRWGVPHLLGASGEDLSTALGYLHANDRFTQMELGRRSCAGRLSEVLGRRALSLDRRYRTLRLWPSAQRMWEGLADESRQWLTAYAQGVNAWLGERQGNLPPSLKLLGIHPDPWEPFHSLCFAYLMAHDLSFWQGRPEEARFLWLARLGSERTRDLLGAGELEIPPEIAELARAVPPEARGGGEIPGSPPGSNNWALAPFWTVTGHPLVANDPHLPLRLPPVWYQVHLRAPDYEVAGMSLPGLPGVIIGQTRHLAWAFTNTMLDDHDLYFEELDEEGRRVRRGEEWIPMEVERHRIPVRGGEWVEMEARGTDIGPLLEGDQATGLPPRSLAWTAYEPADPLRAFLALARGLTLEEVLAHLDPYVCPAQNLVAAHRDGSLLFTVLGRVAERGKGDGRLPVPGWVPEYRWRGLRPRSTNPTVVNPSQGLLVTANHQMLPLGYALPLTADFDTPYRAWRIEEILTSRPSWSALDLASVQTDLVSLYARELVALLGGDYPGDAGRAYGFLAAWDGTMGVTGEAALFVLLERELGRAIFNDERAVHALPHLASRDRLVRVLSGEMSSQWFDDISTPEVETREEMVARALASAWREGTRRWGEDVTKWSYGEIHPLLLEHPLGRLPLLGRWVNRGPFPMPGSATTVAAFGGRWRGETQPVVFGPSMRWIADLADPDASLAVLPGGQSGHPWDVHYDDQLPLYLAGEMRPVAWSEEVIAEATVSRLRLVP